MILDGFGNSLGRRFPNDWGYDHSATEISLEKHVLEQSEYWHVYHWPTAARWVAARIVWTMVHGYATECRWRVRYDIYNTISIIREAFRALVSMRYREQFYLLSALRDIRDHGIEIYCRLRIGDWRFHRLRQSQPKLISGWIAIFNSQSPIFHA